MINWPAGDSFSTRDVFVFTQANEKEHLACEQIGELARSAHTPKLSFVSLHATSSCHRLISFNADENDSLLVELATIGDIRNFVILSQSQCTVSASRVSSKFRETNGMREKKL